MGMESYLEKIYTQLIQQPGYLRSPVAETVKRCWESKAAGRGLYPLSLKQVVCDYRRGLERRNVVAGAKTYLEVEEELLALAGTIRGVRLQLGSMSEEILGILQSTAIAESDSAYPNGKSEVVWGSFPAFAWLDVYRYSRTGVAGPMEPISPLPEDQTRPIELWRLEELFLTLADEVGRWKMEAARIGKSAYGSGVQEALQDRFVWAVADCLCRAGIKKVTHVLPIASAIHGIVAEGDFSAVTDQWGKAALNRWRKERGV